MSITTELTGTLEGAAVMVSALSGMLKAAEKRMDIVGTYSMALLVAFGGGTLRDILLQRRPFFWVEKDYYLLIVLLLSIAFVYLPAVFATLRIIARRTNVIDAMGLALFSLTGLQLSFAAGLPYFPASLIAVITGVAGGVFRDMVVNEIPIIFRPGGLYAIASFAGIWLYIMLMQFEIGPLICTLIAFIMIVVLRLISVFLGITLPHPLWHKKDEGIRD
jgi:uncharacterized membrane protein YeiH